MDDQTIERENLIGRYVAGKLSGSELAAFEEYFLDNEECIEQIEAAERLHRGLEDVAREEHLKSLERGFLISLLASRWARAGLLVGALLVAALIPFFWQQQRVHSLRANLMTAERELAAARNVDPEEVATVRRELVDVQQALESAESRWSAVLDSANTEKERLASRLAAALAPRGNARIISLSPFRDVGVGETPRHEIELPAGDAWLVLSLDVPDPDVTTYRAVLRKGGEAIWQSADLEPDEIGTVVVSFPPGFLEAGLYRLDLVVAGSERSVARFPIRAMARREG